MTRLVAWHFLDLRNGDVVKEAHNLFVLLKHLNLRWLRLAYLRLRSDVVNVQTWLGARTWLPRLKSELTCQARLDLLAWVTILVLLLQLVLTARLLQ